jgi:outer membrane protein TolC
MALPQKIKSYSLLTLLLASSTAIAAPLSLDDYLSQVNGKNQDSVAAKIAAEGAQLSVGEASLMYSPNLFIETQWLDDHFRNALLPTAYEKLQTDTYTVGVKQLTPWGLSAIVSYDLNKLGYINGVDFNTGAVTNRQFYEGTPKIELSLSLWRNLFGSETKAQEEVTRASALAAEYQNRYAVKATRAQAETAYVRLVAARQLAHVYSDSLTLADDMLKFSSKQMRLNLGENSDYLQSQANYEAQKYNLQSAQDSQRVAAREFNRLRNIDSDTVSEDLSLPEISSVKVPERAEVRDDVRAAQEQVKASGAQAKMAAERNKPNLEVYGSYALNDRQTGFSDTVSGSFKGGGQHTSVIGVRFNVPLAIGTSMDVVKGYGLQQDAANTLVGQKTFDQEVQWNDLVQQLNESKKRYEIADSLAKIQKKKVENERSRYNRGRTTTYQTLQFSQDYNTSEAARIQAQSNVLTILATMKTFGETKE